MTSTKGMNAMRFRPAAYDWLIRAVALLGLMAGVAHATETVTYYYTSPQGTVLATADAAGNITSTADYRPYGTQALGAPSAGPGYAGHVNDPDSGLIYMQARYYDPTIGRFLSVDPHESKAASPAGFNRFAYANTTQLAMLILTDVKPFRWRHTAAIGLAPRARSRATTSTGWRERWSASPSCPTFSITRRPGVAAERWHRRAFRWSSRVPPPSRKEQVLRSDWAPHWPLTFRGMPLLRISFGTQLTVLKFSVR